MNLKLSYREIFAINSNWLLTGRGNLIATSSEISTKQEPIQTTHISRFKDPEKGLENNQYLLGIEQASEDLYKKVSDYLKTTHETVQIIKSEDHKKTS